MSRIQCDLILLSWNQLEHVTRCLESLMRCTDVPSRLLIVDNASESPVRALLHSVRPAGAIEEVQLLQNESNEGFPKGMNRGLRVSTAPYVCLLNNDLVFTPGWLSPLIALAESRPEIGVVHPASNTFGERLPSGMAMDDYAAAIRSKRGVYGEVGTCVGFCLLIKREVIHRVGPLSEEIERLFFEDEDYGMRVQAAGYRCVVAQDSYVFHAEHQSVKRLPDRDALFQRNRQRCEARWGRWRRVALPWFAWPPAGSPELRRILDALLSVARRRTYLYLYAPRAVVERKDELFRSVGLAPHGDVIWYAMPSCGASLAAFGWILARQKKRFHTVVATSPAWTAALRGFRRVHRARVLNAETPEAFAAAWTDPSPSPSSS